MQRRRFLRVGTAAAVLPAVLPLAALAQDCPTRPVRIIVGFAAGGVTDVVVAAMR
jgi:tripartite-type tricarboxylate transporter receptor subunit TctC